MKRLLICVAAALAAAPAAAQSIGGCGPTAIAVSERSDTTRLLKNADCFGRARTTATAAEAARRQRAAVITPPPPAAKRAIGINVAGSAYFSTERTFANLALAAGPWLDPDAAWGNMAASKLAANGYPSAQGVLPISVPQPVWAHFDTSIVCTWSGGGALRVDGDRKGERYFDHRIEVTWSGAWTDRPSMLLYLTGNSAAEPMRDLDCREPGLAVHGQFDKRLVDDLRPYAVLRFLDWGAANGNPSSVTWAGRTRPDRLVQDGADGIALEHMIDLANAADADAWFALPWNADDDYLRQFGALVKLRLSTSRRAYVEIGNEPWNYFFPLSHQILAEGLAEKLDANQYMAALYRYAEKSAQVSQIIRPIFADSPSRLVMVVNTQNSNPWQAEQVLGYRDTAKWVDALATAPYFGVDALTGTNAGRTDVDAVMADLEKSRVDVLQKAGANQATAKKYSLRYIAYEGGQHVLAPNDLPTMQKVQRDPRMETLYRDYLRDWRALTGDVMTLYSATGQISQYGAWGIREYAGQPLSETPKRRAVLDALSQ